MEEKITSETFESNSLRITAICWVSNRREELFRTILQVMSLRWHQKLTQRGTYWNRTFSQNGHISTLEHFFFPLNRWKSVLSASLCELPHVSHNTKSWVWLCSQGGSGVGKNYGSGSCRWFCSSSRVIGFSWNWCCPVVKTVAMESVGSQMTTSLLRTWSIVFLSSHW